MLWNRVFSRYLRGSRSTCSCVIRLAIVSIASLWSPAWCCGIPESWRWLVFKKWSRSDTMKLKPMKIPWIFSWSIHMFFKGFSGEFNGEFSWVFHEKIPWIWHENRMKKHENPLNIQRFMAHEKTVTNKKPMKMPWNKIKPTMFFSWLFNDNEKAMNWESIFHGVFKFMPHKKTMIFPWTVEY